MKHGILVGLLVCLMGAAGISQADNAAQQLVKDTTQKIITQMRAERDVIKKDSSHIFQLVDKIVLPHFDFKKMSSWVLGKYWRKANNKQKEQFTQEFRMLLVRTYSKALADNMDAEIKFLPLRGKKNKRGDITVRTEVPQSAGFPIPINYKMHQKDGAWKVFDVVIDGISLVSNYRTSFAKKVRKSGIDSLIASLTERNTGGKK